MSRYGGWLRFALEVAFIVVVAAGGQAAGLSRLGIAVTLAAAFGVAALAEYAAPRWRTWDLPQLPGRRHRLRPRKVDAEPLVVRPAAPPYDDRVTSPAPPPFRPEPPPAPGPAAAAAAGVILDRPDPAGAQAPAAQEPEPGEQEPRPLLALPPATVTEPPQASPPPPVAEPEPPPQAPPQVTEPPPRVAEPPPRAPAAPFPAARAERPGTMRWNVFELESRFRAAGGRDPGRDEEQRYVLLYLREYAEADGTLPASFDGLIRESFPELVGGRR